MIRLPRSATARFVLLYLALSIVGMIPVFLYIYQQTDSAVVHSYRERIEDREATLLLAHRTDGIAGLAREISELMRSGGDVHGALLLSDPDGRSVAGNIAEWPPTLQQETVWMQMRLFRDGDEQSELFALSTTHLPSGHRLLVGTMVEDREHIREALLIALAGALILAIPIGLAGSLILLRSTNRRIDEIGRIAAGIAAGDLSGRIDTRGADDSFARLAATINAMLARIEQLVEQLRLVTDSLAHDLRSPLTRIRASIEKATANSSPELQERAMEAISNEVDGMLRLISATLEISRTEAGIGRENFQNFDVGELLRDLCEIYQPLAEDRAVAIEVERPRSIGYTGNRELIGQAVSNLIDNALKYGNGGSIQIGADESDSAISLWVADRGGGIPEDRRADAIRKYARLEQARTSEGSGLGLALVRAVARLHDGELVLEDNRPGLRAVIDLPRKDLDSTPPASG